MLSAKQNEYIREANERLNFKIGAVRSGKSYVDVSFTILDRLRSVKDKDGLNVILGVSQATIERNVLQPMRERYTDKIVKSVNSRGIAKVFGQEVYCLGAEKVNQVAKIQGMSIKYLYGDEVAKWNKDVFMMALSRLDKDYSRFDAACNPESPNHWLKKFLDNGEIDAYIQHYTIWDNPFLPKKFVDNLCKEYEGTVYYGRYIEGEWTLAEGLVFPRYEDALVDALPDVPVTEYCISLDYGTLNPFAALLWEKRGNIWYAVKELYYSGRETGIQKTDEEYLKMLLRFAAEVEMPEYRGAFGSKGKQPISVIIDPSAASMIALLNRSERFSPIQADNNVYEYGLQNTNIAIARGLIKVHRRCENWIDEAQSYVWNASAIEDQVVKEYDHLMDATRYFVNTKGLVTTDSQYKSIFS